MKDNISLIAAATGGFMLSVALSGILQGGPVISLQGQSSFRPLTVSTLRPATDKKESQQPGAKIHPEP